VKTCVYRIVQESLHNAEKHAGASRAKVTIGGAGGGLAVEIEDDGRGFHDPPNGRPGAPAGLGILGMRERAARLGGTLAVDTRPGGGTRVRLTVPVPRAAGEPAARHTAPRVMEA
jgi:signal transduction histidine kinase